MSSGLGNVVGVGAKLAMGGSPLGAFGGAIAGQALSGGGGKGYAQPNIAYGTGENTYTMGGKPVDTSKYWIQGDKGVYNTLPVIGDTSNKAYMTAYNAPMVGMQNRLDPQKQAQYMLDQMKGDQKAINTFNQRFLTPDGYNNTGPFGAKVAVKGGYDFGIGSSPAPANSVLSAINGGQNNNLYNVSQYAAAQHNPFFMAYGQPEPAPAPVPAPTPEPQAVTPFQPAPVEQPQPAPAPVQQVQPQVQEQSQQASPIPTPPAPPTGIQQLATPTVKPRVPDFAGIRAGYAPRTSVFTPRSGLTSLPANRWRR